MRTTMAGALLLAAVLTAATVQAQPQKIYRCGPDGRELSQQPCREPAAPLAGTAAAPSEAERAAAVARAKREAETASRMERERLQREAQEARQAGGAVALDAPRPKAKADAPRSDAGPPPKPSMKKPHKPPRTSGDFAAVSPAPKKAKAR